MERLELIRAVFSKTLISRKLFLTFAFEFYEELKIVQCYKWQKFLKPLFIIWEIVIVLEDGGVPSNGGSRNL